MNENIGNCVKVSKEKPGKVVDKIFEVKARIVKITEQNPKGKHTLTPGKCALFK